MLNVPFTYTTLGFFVLTALPASHAVGRAMTTRLIPYQSGAMLRLNVTTTPTMLSTVPIAPSISACFKGRDGAIRAVR